MRFILDTSLFFLEYPLEGEIFTTPSVVSELADLRSKCRYESLLARGLRVHDPPPDLLDTVSDAAGRAGDRERLSPADSDILALALDLGGTILSDDYAVQNVARILSIPFRPIRQRGAKKRIWKFRCTGCGRFSKEPGECMICGSQIKRTIK
jgi:UPF0271 protein